MESQQPPSSTLPPTLIKGLASCDTTLRSKSLITLLNFLPSQTLISDDDFKKLWKSLFYSLWHCDKLPNQIHLINRLSSLLPSLSYPLSLSYFSHFLTTMRKEWPGIDHLRLDKFYLMIRSFMRCFFDLMKKLNWDLSVLGEFIRVLEIRAFFFVDDEGNGDNGLGNGVAYHIVSVFCDEVKPFLPLSFEVVSLLFRPFVRVLSESDNKVLIGKVRSNVFEVLIRCGKRFLEGKKLGGSESESNDKEVVLFGTIAVSIGLSSKLFELGSAEGCVQGNRKVLFGLHEEFMRLEKEKAALGIEVSLPEGDDVVPIEGGTSNGVLEVQGVSKGSDEGKKAKLKEKDSKKKKKKKKGFSSDGGGGSGNDTNSEAEMVDGGDGLNVGGEEGEVKGVELNEDLISNLQKQFEKIADESGLVGDGVSVLDSPQVSGKTAKKRKRSKSASKAAASGGQDGVEKDEAVVNTEDTNAKRVRFAMKNNIVWKPHCPLPPQDVRIPPSSTPRGSALKKGLSPGPIRESALEVKKAKKKKQSPLKKARKVKSISPSVKRVKKKKVKLMSP